jgi:hypothetical protein
MYLNSCNILIIVYILPSVLPFTGVIISKRFIYTSDFRGQFHVKLARFWEHIFCSFIKRASLMETFQPVTQVTDCFTTYSINYDRKYILIIVYSFLFHIKLARFWEHNFLFLY